MIYQVPPPDAPLDQGDIIDGCPVLKLASFIPALPQSVETLHAFERIVILTQTCDLGNQKAPHINTAIVLNATDLVAQGLLKAADIKGPLRSGRVFGWYFLPRHTELGLPEMIVDLRQLHTIRRDVLVALCLRGHRRARVQPLYREHLAQHFANTFSRIGLPEPYETE